MRPHRLLVLGAVFVSAVSLAQQDVSDLKAALSARYAEMKFAMASKDETAIRALLAPGFVSVDADGSSEGASEMVKEVMTLPADPSKQSHTTLLTVQRTGDTALVEQRYEMLKKAKTSDGTERSIAMTTLSRDRWINDKGVWRMAQTVTESLDYAVDGVTVLHQGNPIPH